MAAGTPVSRQVNIYINQASAERSLQKLQSEADKLTKQIELGRKGGKAMTSEIEKLGKTKADISQLTDQISGKMAPAFSQVRSRVTELQRELSRMSRDAPGYAARFAEFQQVNERFQQMRQELQGVREEMDNAGGGAESFGEKVKSVFLGVLGANAASDLIGSVKAFAAATLAANAELSDELADISKATGLSDAAVGELDQSLARLNTRTSASQLREIAVGLGQIGEAATTEAVANVDKIVVALGDEFGGGANEITTTLGVLRNNLQDIKTGNYGEDVLHLGNALNVLGAEGLATAPVVTDFANRLAGVAGTFRLTSGQILGLSASLQELGIPAERGSTAVTKLFQKMATETKTFARVAGVDVQTFNKLVNTDMLAALQAVALGARAAGKDNVTFGRILKDLDADGSGAGEVLSKLAANAELVSGKVKLATSALKETGSVTEEFDKKNNNLAGTLEKIGKRFSSAFANSLVLQGLTALVLNFAKLIGAVERTDTALDSFRKQQERVNELEKNIVPLINRYDELSRKASDLGGTTKLSKDEQVELNKAISTLSSTMPGAISQFDKYGKAIAISSTQARDFIRLQRLILQERNRDAIKDQEKLEKDLDAQVKMYASYVPKIVAEKRKYGGDVDKDGVNAYDKQITSAQVKVGELQARLAGVRGILRELRGEPLLDDVAKPAASSAPVVAAYTSGPTAADESKAKRAQEALIAFQNKLEQLRADAEAAEDGNDAKEIQRVKDKYKKLADEAEKYYRDFGKRIAEAAQLSELEKSELATLTAKQAEKRNEKEYQTSLQTLSDFYNQQKQETGDAYSNGLITRKEYADALRAIDAKEADDRAAIASNYKEVSKKAAKDAEDAKTKALEEGIKSREAAEAQSDADKLSQAKRAVLTARDGSKAQLEAKRAYLIQEANLEKLSAQQRLTRQVELNKALNDLDLQHYVSKAQTAVNYTAQLVSVASSYFAMLDNSQQAELSDFRKTQDEKKTRLSDSLAANRLSQTSYNAAVQKLDKETAQKEADLKHRKFVRDKALGIANGIIQTAQAVLQTLASTPYPANIPLAIAVGAAGAAQTAVIAKAKEPKYAKGGIASGASHAQGGISLVNATGQKVGEMEGGEAYMILSKETTRNNGPLISELLSASMYGGGRAVRPKYLYEQPAPINYSRAQENIQYVRRYSSGGIARAESGSSAANADFNELLRKLSDQLDRGISASVLWNDIDRKNTQMQQLRLASSLGAVGG